MDLLIVCSLYYSRGFVTLSSCSSIGLFTSVCVWHAALQGDQLQPARPTMKARREPLHSRIQSNPFSKDYLTWKERVIREARAKLNQPA